MTSAVAAGLLAGRPQSRRAAGSRGYLEIVRANVLTLFNAILAALLVVVIALGDYRDGLFAGVLVANILIGVVQEVRAKRVLDRLALLVAPRARVWRDGELRDVAEAELVEGDVVRLEPGDQLVSDGRLLAARGLSLDESMLTGESDPVERAEGQRVLSGAFCVAGSGDYVVEAVGPDSFAERIAAEARGTRGALSPLQGDINRILRVTVAVMVPLGSILVAVLALRDTNVRDGGRTAVAGLLPLVPEGLVLLTSLTFAVAAVRLARLGTLVQRLNAVESLASVDVVCLDKTGTLTDNRLRVVAVEPATGWTAEALRAGLGELAASAATRNGTLQAIHDYAPAAPLPVVSEVPFRSDRKWSAVELDRRGTLVLGAPDVLAAQGVELEQQLARQVREQAAKRRRVVLLATSDQSLEGRLPRGLVAAGLVVLEEGLRPDAADTIAFLVREHVEVKIISGDSLETVTAVASAVGVPHAERGVDGGSLPEDGDQIADAALRHAVFARVRPEQKRALVRGLAARGRYVAMVGDGVNDVLALKEARLAIAMGNGTQMAKGVADLVLLSNDFATVPRAIEEGRRILRNCHRVAGLFVTKSVYSALLVATVGLAPVAYPFLPRHLTIVSTLTVGLPAFFLALAASEGPVRSACFLRALARFVLPAGAGAALIIGAAYVLARRALAAPLIEARTVTVGATIATGLAIVIAVERGRSGHVRGWIWLIVAGATLLAIGGLGVPALRAFFELSRPGPGGWGVVAGAAAACSVLVAVLPRFEPANAPAGAEVTRSCSPVARRSGV